MEAIVEIWGGAVATSGREDGVQVVPWELLLLRGHGSSPCGGAGTGYAQRSQRTVSSTGRRVTGPNLPIG